LQFLVLLQNGSINDKIENRGDSQNEHHGGFVVELILNKTYEQWIEDQTYTFSELQKSDAEALELQSTWFYLGKMKSRPCQMVQLATAKETPRKA